MIVLSKLKPFIADSDEGPDTVLYLKGFKNRQEIEFFMDRLMTVSFSKKPDNIKRMR